MKEEAKADLRSSTMLTYRTFAMDGMFTTKTQRFLGHSSCLGAFVVSLPGQLRNSCP